MSAAKTSRNRQRKAAYAALADKGSRNQDAIPKMACPKCGGMVGAQCDECGGIGTVAARKAESAAVVERIKAPKREANARRKARQERAAVIAAERAKRSPGDQLHALDVRLGNGIGAVDERARLRAQIANKRAA